MEQTPLKRVLNLGAGWQSSTLLLMSCRGVLPRLDAAVFADTQYEPPAVYEHLAWLKGEAETAGIPVHIVTAGNLRADALAFRTERKSADGKRFASLPVFVRNEDGTQGVLPRQCTKEYKILPCEEFIRRQIIGLRKGQRGPKRPVVESWFGISQDEGQRAVHPGRWESRLWREAGLFGSTPRRKKVWSQHRWKHHVYPLMNLLLTADRRSQDVAMLPRTMTREDCGLWLREHYPDRVVPRSACICCPFRRNEEWRAMRDKDRASWLDAVAFDHSMRRIERSVPLSGGNGLAGSIYLHRDMVPLDMVDLDTQGPLGWGGCGSLGDGQDGLCDV